MVKKKNKQMMKLILVAGINWGLIGLTNINFIKEILNKFNLKYIERYIYILVGFSALFLFKRDIFLPFLGETVIPQGILEEKTPNNYSIEKKIKILPNTKVIYWAAEPSNKVMDNPWDAYKDYKNAGVATSDSNGNVVFKVREPSSYKKPYKNKILKPHIHYRYYLSSGMMSRIETVFL